MKQEWPAWFGGLTWPITNYKDTASADCTETIGNAKSKTQYKLIIKIFLKAKQNNSRASAVRHYPEVMASASREGGECNKPIDGVVVAVQWRIIQWQHVQWKSWQKLVHMISNMIKTASVPMMVTGVVGVGMARLAPGRCLLQQSPFVHHVVNRACERPISHTLYVSVDTKNPKACSFSNKW